MPSALLESKAHFQQVMDMAKRNGDCYWHIGVGSIFPRPLHLLDMLSGLKHVNNGVFHLSRLLDRPPTCPSLHDGIIYHYPNTGIKIEVLSELYLSSAVVRAADLSE
jgi:hypothetical protein